MATKDATNEQWYDSEIEPVLLELAERCKERGVSLVSVAEYDPGKRGAVYQLTENAGLPMVMLKLCAMAAGGTWTDT